MTGGRINPKWCLAAIPLLAMAWGIATLATAFAAGGAALPGPSPALDRIHCESYPYTVICAKNETPGGPIGCFDTLCDAVAAGAFQCRRTTSACEPH